MEDLLKILIDYGSLGIMCAVLLWLHVQTSKKSDAQTAQFLDQLEKIRQSSKEEEEKIRNRFMEVIAKYDDERTQLRSNLAGQIKDLESKVDALATQMAGISAKVQEIINEQKMREIASQHKRQKG